MVLYNCEKCDKVFNRKSTYIYHINRKNPCLQEYISINKRMNPNESKHICVYCKKSFTTNSNMRKHEKRCIIKKNNSEILVKSNNELDKKNSTTYDLVKFGDENLEQITNKELTKFWMKGFSSVTLFALYIYFNPKRPKYRNVVIKNAQCYTYDGYSFVKSDKTEVLSLIYNRCRNFLNCRFKVASSQLSINIIYRYNKTLDHWMDATRYDYDTTIEHLCQKKSITYKNYR